MLNVLVVKVLITNSMYLPLLEKKLVYLVLLTVMSVKEKVKNLLVYLTNVSMDLDLNIKLKEIPNILNVFLVKLKMLPDVELKKIKKL